MPSPERTTAPATSPDAAARFGERLTRLIEHIYPPDQKAPYTNTQIAAATGLTSQYVGLLRRGQRAPSVDKAIALADVFEVRVEYFVRPAEHQIVQAIDRDLERLALQRAGKPQKVWHRCAGAHADAELLTDDEVRGIAEGTAELPRDLRGPIRSLVDALRRTVGLPVRPAHEEEGC
ncbi:helix-turn-helix transcriptional regulator [Streptomyces sp. ODS28]|uniref:helix-turn-helix domain-containing protein n=1 Tax=Streptomyces sp. ODS28 TaxID=3136688 RepID=UPI0031E8ACFA